MSLPKTISTPELQVLTGLSKSGVATFEQEGVIKRSAVNEWPLPDTLVSLVKHLRARKSPASDGRIKWENARARREEMKAQREEGRSLPLSVFEEFVDTTAFTVLRWLDAIPARLAARDLTLRRRAQEVVTWARAGLSADMKKLAADPKGGKAL